MIGITGASGVLGSALLREWPAREWSVFRDDIRDFDAVRRWVEATPLTTLLHLAAVVPVTRVESDPRQAFDVNVGGTINVCEALRLVRPATWLFVASSSHVYASCPSPIREDATMEPISFYGFTKHQSEQAAMAWAERFGLHVAIGRIFSFSASNQPADYLLPSLATRIRQSPKGAIIPLRGGLQTRDFLTTGAIARAIGCLEHDRATGIFNIGSGTGIRLIDLATTLARLLGRDDVRIVAEGDASSCLVADISKLAALGFEPRNATDELLVEVAGI